MQIQCLNTPQGNYVRRCWGTTPVFQTKEPTDWSAPDGPEGLAAAPTRVIKKAPQPNFARNLTRSFFEIGHKRCNSNNVNSMFEQATGELRATLLGNHSDQRGGRTHRQAAPVASRYTRCVALHPLRRATPDQNGCIAYGSGAPHNAGTHHRRLCRPRTYHPQAGTHETTKPQAPTATTEHGLTGNTSQPTGQARKPHPKHDEAATGFPATASSLRSAEGTQHSSASDLADQAVMSTWSSTAARPASRRATGTRNGEQDT